MPHRALSRLHAAFGVAALLMLTSFWTVTALSELSGNPAVVAAVKRAIAWGLVGLVPCLAAVGGSGFRLAGRRARSPLLSAKARRMQVAALNGLLVLAPCALFLAWKADAGALDAAFYAVQAVELSAGGLNIALLVLNMRDGMRLRPRTRVQRA
jgi:hypothetical protein